MVLRADRGPHFEPGPVEINGSAPVAEVILERGTPVARFARPAIIDGQAGAYVALPSGLLSVVKFTVERGRVTGLDLVLDPDTLRSLRI